MEKAVSPIRKRALKRPAPAVRTKPAVPVKKPRPASTRMDRLEADATTMKSSMDSFMAQMGTFLQMFQGSQNVQLSQPVRQRLQPSTVVPPLVPQESVPDLVTPEDLARSEAPLPHPQSVVGDRPVVPRSVDIYQIPRVQSTQSLN